MKTLKELTIRQLNRLSDKPFFSVKDPISALTHLIGFIVSVALTPVLFIKASYSMCTITDLIALAVYRLSVSLLYRASTAYHTFILPGRGARILKKFDHMSIFVMIAGTYTDPPALAFSNSICSKEAPALGYSTVYPLSMFLRIFTAQIVVLFFCG